MRHRYLLMGVLLIMIYLLAACSGGDAPVVPSEVPVVSEAIQQETLTEGLNEPNEQVSVEPAETNGIQSTQSSPFEQSYEANQISDRDYSEYDIITLLPPDAIPALTNPRYYDVSGADQEYDPDEMVLGVEFNGDARAYSVGLLSSHEIVNDTVGGIHLAVTW